MKNIEKYLAENRQQLDVETPDDSAIWERISDDLSLNGPVKTKRGSGITFYRILKIAAVAFIIFSIGYITKDLVGRKDTDRAVTLSDISLALGRKEIEYRTLVSVKTGEVRALTTTDNLIIKELFDEIKRLDVVYDQSLKDLKELGYNGPLTIEREISGTQQFEDVRKEKLYLERLIA